jgi:hypothetical protein
MFIFIIVKTLNLELVKSAKQLSRLNDDLMIYSRTSKKRIEFESVEFNSVMEIINYNL